jgi:hypothetical protein
MLAMLNVVAMIIMSITLTLAERVTGRDAIAMIPAMSIPVVNLTIVPSAVVVAVLSVVVIPRLVIDRASATGNNDSAVVITMVFLAPAYHTKTHQRTKCDGAYRKCLN